MQEPSSRMLKRGGMLPSSILDVPAHLLLPYLHGLVPSQRRALMQSSRSMFELAVASAPQLQVSMHVGEEDQGCTAGMQSLAAQAIQHHPSMQLCLHAPAAASSSVIQHTILPSVGAVLSSLTLQGLVLDALLPAAAVQACPALQRLTVLQCQLSDAADAQHADLSACSQLQHLGVLETEVWAPDHNEHLAHIAQLPCLSSLELDCACVSEQALASASQLASTLTSLQLGYSADKWHCGAVTGVLRWASRLHGLQVVQMHKVSDLFYLWPDSVEFTMINWHSQLQHLHTLLLPCLRVSDSMLSSLLRMPCLRDLQVKHFHVLWSHSNKSCKLQRWQIQTMDMHLLPDLPLHSLTHALCFEDFGIFLVDAPQLQKVVDNMARCKPGFLPPSKVLTFYDTIPVQIDQATVLRALQAFLNQFCGKLVIGWAATAEFLSVCAECGMLLGQIHDLEVSSVKVTPDFWQQAQVLLPGVRTLTIACLNRDVLPDMAMYVGSLPHPVTVVVPVVCLSPEGVEAHASMLKDVQEACKDLVGVTVLDD